jgi:hypothetical protein
LRSICRKTAAARFAAFSRFQAAVNQYAYISLFLDFIQFLAVDIILVRWIVPAHMDYFAFWYIKFHTPLLGPVKSVIEYQLQLIPFFFRFDFLCPFGVVRKLHRQVRQHHLYIYVVNMDSEQWWAQYCALGHP